MMMRGLFLFLVLANVAFFAWSRYVSPPEQASDPAPLTRQVQPDKLKVIGPGDPVSGRSASPAASAPVAALLPTSTALGCLEWGGFTSNDVMRAEKALEPLALGDRLGQRRIEEGSAWWVFIPPQGSRVAAQKKAAELKALGIDDYFVVQDDGPSRWALSLGVFRTGEAAEAHLATLRARGVRSAQAGAREAQVSKVWLQVKDVDAALHARLKELSRSVEGSELRNCPA